MANKNFYPLDRKIKNLLHRTPLVESNTAAGEEEIASERGQD